MWRRGVVALVFVALAGCGDEGIEPSGPDAGARSGVAPPHFVAGEQALADGDTAISLAANASAVYRLETQPGQHVAYALSFPTTVTTVSMAVDRWDGGKPVEIGLTDAGGGVRFLAVVDQAEPRTFWLRVKNGPVALAGTLTVTRTSFAEGIHCVGDCDRLMQLPLANDPTSDGYDTDSGTIFRYQFGRRDMVMYLRYTAHRRAAEGKTPFIPHDLSQWDGMTPGTDVGAPRHLSHQRGKDADISLYGSDGLALWRNYCTTRAVSGGTECVPGTRTGFDAYETAREIAHMYESGRVTMCFLDHELITVVAPAAQQAASDGMMGSALVPLFSDGTHLQHWPNHENHVHVRVSELPYGARIVPGAEPFEGP